MIVSLCQLRRRESLAEWLRYMDTEETKAGYQFQFTERKVDVISTPQY